MRVMNLSGGTEATNVDLADASRLANASPIQVNQYRWPSAAFPTESQPGSVKPFLCSQPGNPFTTDILANFQPTAAQPDPSPL